MRPDPSPVVIPPAEMKSALAILLSVLCVVVLFWRSGGEEQAPGQNESSLPGSSQEDAAKEPGGPLDPTNGERVSQVARGFAVILDAETQKPIAGARLQQVEALPASTQVPSNWYTEAPWVKPSAPLETSDAKGKLSVVKAPGERVLFEVHAAGYSPYWVSPERLGNMSATAVQVRLQRSASLTGKLRGDIPLGASSITIGVSAFAHNLQGNHVPADLLGQLQSPTWKTDCRPDGGFDLQGLPTGVPVYVWLEQGGVCLYQSPEALRLSPGTANWFEYEFEGQESESILEGYLVDESNGPIGNQVLWIVPAWDQERYTRLWSSSHPVRQVLADGTGRFEVHNLPQGEYRIGPAPKGPEEPSFAMQFEATIDGPLAVRPPVMHSIEGTVHFEGEPLAGVLVHSSHQSKAVSDASGRFEIECFGDREVTLSPASLPFGDDKLVSVREVSAQPGDSGVQIAMVPAAKAQVKIMDASTGRPLKARITCRECVVGGPERKGMASDWSVEDALQPGNYLFWAEAADGRVGRSEVLRLASGQNLQHLELTLSYGGQATVFPGENVAGLSLQLWEGQDVIFEKPLTQAPFTLPEGTYEVRYQNSNSQESWAGGNLQIVEGQSSRLNLPHRGE